MCCYGVQAIRYHYASPIYPVIMDDRILPPSFEFHFSNESPELRVILFLFILVIMKDPPFPSNEYAVPVIYKNVFIV